MLAHLRQLPDSRRRWLSAALLLLGTVGLFAVTGCTSVIHPPRAPEDPVAVYLLMDDQHRGLWLPAGASGFVGYGFGDWDWFATNHDAWYYVFDTVLWPTHGTLGRRSSAARSADELRRELHWMQLHEIVVARGNMEALRAELADSFAKGADEQVYNELHRMTFVPHPDSYWFLYNCNDAVTGWLRKLGCSVSWVPIRLDLTMGQPR